MILYVDNEHASRYERAGTGGRLRAARLRITYMLQDVVGDVCLVQRYPDVDLDLIRRLDIGAVFISGHGAPPDAYDPADQEGLRSVVREGTVPVFGLCGGLQFMAATLGVEIRRVGRIPEGEDDPVPEYEPGWRKEVGYHPVSLVGDLDHPLLAGLGDAPVFRHAHTYELASVPPGFEVLAATELTGIQLAAHTSLPLAGSQFHPEYWTDEHPAGRRLIENFSRWVGVGA